MTSADPLVVREVCMASLVAENFSQELQFETSCLRGLVSQNLKHVSRITLG